MVILDVVRFLQVKQASELLLAPGLAPRVRLTDGICPLDLPPLDWRALEEIVWPFFNDRQWKEFQGTGGFERDVELVLNRSPLRLAVSRSGVFFRRGKPA